MPGRSSGSSELIATMRRRVITESQQKWRRRVNLVGAPVFRVGVLMIAAVVAIVATETLVRPDLAEWPILALAYALSSHPYIVFPLIVLGGLFCGIGITWLLIRRAESGNEF